jgi:hypothetical protein
MERTEATLHEVQRIFMVISRWILLRMRNISDKTCSENQTTFCVQFFPKSRPLWHKVLKYCRAGEATDDNIILRTHFARCIPKATDTNSEYVILIASPYLQWLHESTSELVLYVYCLSYSTIFRVIIKRSLTAVLPTTICIQRNTCIPSSTLCQDSKTNKAALFKRTEFLTSPVQ